MLSTAGYVNYNSIQEYQIWLHSSTASVECPFYREHIRVGWHSTFLEELFAPQRDPNDDTITFIANCNAHFLLYTNLVFHTPEIISQNPNIEVALSPNFMHNYAKLAELKFNDISVQKFDTVGADILIQTDSHSGQGKREQYLRDIGNLSCLTKFSSHLPSKRLSLHCPWSFSKKISKCIPLCLSTSTIVSMTFKLERDPSKLIRVLDITDSSQRALKYKDSVRIIGLENDLFSFPTFYGKYVLITPKELKWHKEIKNREVFYDSFEEFDDDNLVRNGDIASVSLNSILPVKALFPVAQNMTSTYINNHSNYSTDIYDSYSGSSAISEYNLSYGMVSILNNVEAEVFSNDEIYWNCTSCPERPGYAAIVLPSSLERDEDVGIILSSVGGSLNVLIKDQQNSCYKFKVRALVTNVFKYENNMVTISKNSDDSHDTLHQNWNSWNL
jgi:hypothetical protein